jgi:hypothetical protein
MKTDHFTKVILAVNDDRYTEWRIWVCMVEHRRKVYLDFQMQCTRPYLGFGWEPHDEATMTLLGRMLHFGLFRVTIKGESLLELENGTPKRFNKFIGELGETAKRVAAEISEAEREKAGKG